MSEDHPRLRIAYYKLTFSSPSDALMAEQLKALSRYEPVILTARLPETFGLPAAGRSLSNLNLLARSLNQLQLRLSDRSPYLEEQMRREECRLIHALSGADGRYGLRLKRQMHLPLVVSFSCPDITRLPKRLPRPYERLFAEGDLLLVDSDAARKHLLSLGCLEGRLRIQYPGVDVDAIPYSERQPAANGQVNILLVGRMVEKKGIPYALQAFANVRRYQRQVTLTIIGDGPERRTIEALLRELNLQDTRLLGTQPRSVVLSEMQRAHIFIQASVTPADGDSEGIPLALLEAQASGLPAIGTWTSGIPEVIEDGQSGYLVSACNSHALAERLRHLVEHPDLWVSFGQAGRAIIEERFALRQQTDLLESHYDELLARRAG